MKEPGLRFVEIVAKLMDHLLQYRDVIHTESQEHRMLCTVNLLEFYSEINRNEMYIRYISFKYTIGIWLNVSTIHPPMKFFNFFIVDM